MRLFISLSFLLNNYLQVVWAHCPNAVVDAQIRAPHETICLRKCTSEPKCTGVWYQNDHSSELNGGNPFENCLLWTNQDSGTFSYARSALGYRCWSRIRHSTELGQYMGCPSDTVQETALAMGFDLSLTLGIRTVFLKKLSGSLDPASAEAECFRQGGILPMEDSEDFIETMSELLGDHSTPRLVSLVSEHEHLPPGHDIAWTLGPKEWGRDEDSATCPRYSTWPQSHYNSSRHFVVNPMTNTFEPAPFNLTRSNVHCQFLGRNLATGKQTIASSTFRSETYGKHLTVDGQVLDGQFWSGGDGSPIKPDWFAVDLEAAHAIRHIFFFTRAGHFGSRNTKIRTWIASQAPASESNLKRTTLKLCGIYPYRQNNNYLSGVTCSNYVVGQYVVLENAIGSFPMALGEIGIFGSEI